MASNNKIAEFPDVESKLQKPAKQSAFERQKAEAEAKRKREAEETKAVYEEFIKDFDRGDDEPDSRSYRNYQQARPGFGHSERPPVRDQVPMGGGFGKRHFGVPTAPSLKSGPGSLGPGPTSFGKKKQFDGFDTSSQRDRGGGRLGFGDESLDDVKSLFSGRAEEKAIAKPTILLNNMPPNSSRTYIKSLLPDSLAVENVKIVPPSGPGGSDRKATSAIVTLSSETPGSEIDSVVSSLQNRYLGRGFYLSLHRHLSSAALSSLSLVASTTSSSPASQPFGAKTASETGTIRGSLPEGHNMRFAPEQYRGAGINNTKILHVDTRPPQDIRKLRMIHNVIEAILEHGPRYEALLMSRTEVQQDEKWAWIWDARSEGGTYYRWKLWETCSEPPTDYFVPLFVDSSAWKVPDRLPHEFASELDDFLTNPNYDMFDDSDDEDRRDLGPAANALEGDMLLNAIETAKLAQLLARLPTTFSKLKNRDISRVARLALEHSSKGAREIVEMIVRNIERPLAYTPANPDYAHPSCGNGDGQGQECRSGTPAGDGKDNDDILDTSGAQLVGLYIVSEILSGASTSGIRHAWRYRTLFETAFRKHKTFEKLGMAADKFKWGRMRAEKWKRSVGMVFSTWEGWCVFPADTHEFFVSTFENPPALKKKEVNVDEAEKKGGRWKSIETAAAVSASTSSKSNGFRPVSDPAPGNVAERSQSHDREKSGGSEVMMDSDIEGWSNVDISSVASWSGGEEDIDGQPLPELGGLKVGDDDVVMKGTAKAEPPVRNLPRKRMRAVDMYDDLSGHDN